MINLQVSGNAHSLYPADMIFGLVWFDDNTSLEIPKLLFYSGEWGEILSNIIALEPTKKVPSKLSVLWISLVEAQMYYVEEKLPANKISDFLNDKENFYTHIVVGMGLYGKCAIWIAGQVKSTLVCSFDGELINDFAFKEICPYNLNMDLKSYCQMMLNKAPISLNNSSNNGLPKRNIFNQYMQQYRFRYIMVFGRLQDNEWTELTDKENYPIVNSQRDLCMDGTYNLTYDKKLCQFHQSGIPKRIISSWSSKNNTFVSYFDFFESPMIKLFEKFYGIHKETKSDFIIRIDAENKKYELALYRQGLKEPVVIPESAYQLIVFKNKFEDYRSENYDQPRGAWIW